MPEEDARHRKALHKTVKILTFQNKILCNRPVCCQIETEEHDITIRHQAKQRRGFILC